MTYELRKYIKGRITDWDVWNEVIKSDGSIHQLSATNGLAWRIKTLDDKDGMTYTYDFVHPDYTIPTTNANRPSGTIPGPFSGMNFYDTDDGMIAGVQGWWCLQADPNDFYGCDYPEIWKLTSGIIAGFFFFALGLAVWVAVKRDPFKKITVGASEPRLLMAPHDEDIEHLQIVVLQ